MRKPNPILVALLAFASLLSIAATIQTGTTGGGIVVGYNNFNTSQFSAPSGGTVSITNSARLTNSAHYLLNGVNQTWILPNGQAMLLRSQSNPNGVYWYDESSEGAIAYLTTSFVNTTVGITNNSWYHGTGIFTNVNHAWLKGVNDNVYWMYDTPAGDVYGSGVKWTRTGNPKWWLVNQDSSSTEDLTVLNQITTEVFRFKTNGTAKAANIFEVGSYSYTLSTNLSTPGNTQTTMFSVPVASGNSVSIKAFVTAKQASSANAATYEVVAVGSNNGGTTAIQGTAQDTFTPQETVNGAVTIDFDDTTDTGRVRVTGVTATEIAWGALITVVISQ
jgi:hypothetical protein